MKSRFKVLGMALTLMLLLASFTAVAQAGGLSPDKLEKAGWFCNAIAGEPHCFPPSVNFFAIVTGAETPASVQVMVFGADGDFRSTELLIRADLYAGQPCPQDYLIPLDFYGDSDPEYIACHHR